MMPSRARSWMTASSLAIFNGVEVDGRVMRVPWLEAGVVTLASVLLATLAGLWPAYHATRLRIPDKRYAKWLKSA